jgi:hypothetical protein
VVRPQIRPQINTRGVPGLRKPTRTWTVKGIAEKFFIGYVIEKMNNIKT